MKLSERRAIKIGLVALVVVVLATLAQVYAFADSTTGTTAEATDPRAAVSSSDAATATPSSIQQSNASPNPSSSPSPKATAKTQAVHSSLAKKTFSAVAGFIVGTPVCMIRKPIDEVKEGITGATGNSHDKRQTIPAGILWAPFALTAGVLEAPLFALDNCLVHCTKPFSKAQFSLSDKKLPQEEPLRGTDER